MDIFYYIYLFITIIDYINALFYCSRLVLFQNTLKINWLFIIIIYRNTLVLIIHNKNEFF